MFKIEVCVSEKNGKKFYKLYYVIQNEKNGKKYDVFLTFDAVAITTLANCSPIDLDDLELGSYDLGFNKLN